MMFSYGPLHTDEQVSGDLLELIYDSSVQLQYIAWKTCWQRWIIETNSKRESRKSVPQLFFYKDSISIKSPTKVDIPLNKETKPNNDNLHAKHTYLGVIYMQMINWSTW